MKAQVRRQGGPEDSCPPMLLAEDGPDVAASASALVALAVTREGFLQARVVPSVSSA